MKILNRIIDLALIMIIVWFSMLIMLIAIDIIVVPMNLPIKSVYEVLIEALIKLMISGIMALSWLWLWVMLVQRYIKKTSK
ncbi:MAG: hypothetical protein N3E39_03010 [Candidatus Methanomethylicia archaeon]|nr:hypothetical protein [Candidatus Methanomethylicia archaeon]